MTRLVLISDTHNLWQPELPDGDILIHAGDLTMGGQPNEIVAAIRWLGAQTKRYEAVITTAGNHDFFAESYPMTMHAYCMENGVKYLLNRGTNVHGINIWGSPVSPWFHDWAFGPHRGLDIKRYWDMIPNDTDVLITHGPPARVLDLCPGGNVGCEDLLEAVKRVQPRLHVFGHIHQGRGETELPGLRTHFVNAAVLDGSYKPAGGAFVFDIDEP